ncbi:MAG: MarR family transcriptional regulator [Alphaproteobacteria bacterium]|nr:MAG: MarR family transcriptional regulator [Alphaproteobacteria bacterium]
MPLARRTDPVTSHQAADRMRTSGAARTHAEKVLAFVRANPGSTGHEIAAGTGLAQVEVIRRLGDLQRSGEVEKRPAPEGRRCRIKPHSRQSLWFAIC